MNTHFFWKRSVYRRLSNSRRAFFYRKFGKLKEQEERVITQNFYFEGKKPRFYQQIAVQKQLNNSK